MSKNIVDRVQAIIAMIRSRALETAGLPASQDRAGIYRRHKKGTMDLHDLRCVACLVDRDLLDGRTNGSFRRSVIDALVDAGVAKSHYTAPNVHQSTLVEILDDGGRREHVSWWR